MSDTITSLVARVVYVSGAWLYVLHESTDTLFGVLFANNESDPHPEFSTVTRTDAGGNAPIHHPLTVVTWWPNVIAGFLSDSTYGTSQAPRVQGDQDSDQAYQRGIQDGRAEENRRHQAWIDSLVSDAHEFANEHSLCSEFDRFMSEHNLPTRSRDYMVTYRVTVPNGVDPYDYDMEDLQSEAEDFCLVNVESV